MGRDRRDAARSPGHPRRSTSTGATPTRDDGSPLRLRARRDHGVVVAAPCLDNPGMDLPDRLAECRGIATSDSRPRWRRRTSRRTPTGCADSARTCPSSARSSRPSASTATALQQAEEARTLAKDESDPEMAAFLREEADAAEARVAELRARLEAAPRPEGSERRQERRRRDPRRGRGRRGGAVGRAPCSRCISTHAERQRWKTEVLSASPSDLGGFKEVVLEVQGQGRLLAPEARVRRPPRPAGPGHRVLGPDPHLHRDGRGPARGRGGRGRDPAGGPARSTCSVRRGRAASR